MKHLLFPEVTHKTRMEYLFWLVLSIFFLQISFHIGTSGSFNVILNFIWYMLLSSLWIIIIILNSYFFCIEAFTEPDKLKDEDPAIIQE